MLHCKNEEGGNGYMSKVSSYVFLAIIILALVTGFSNLGTAVAAEPQRGISLSTIYPGVTIAKNQNVTLPITVANQGEVDEQINIEISSTPQGWEANLVDREFGIPYAVRSLYLPAEGEAQVIYFQAKPPAGIESGDYIFMLKAVSEDELVQSSLKITIGIEEKVTVLARVKLTTDFTSLRGRAGSSFEFSIDMTNEGSEDLTYNFSAEAPPQWEVSFSPEYAHTLIANMRMKAGETKGVDVRFTPPAEVAAGDYPLTVKATSGNIEGSIDLMATVLPEEKTFTYEPELHTITGRLNAETIAGRETYLSILVYNSGTGDLENVNFSSSKPEDWVITFNPNRLEYLAAGETRELGVTITPASKTIAGDYLITLRTYAHRGADKIELRVTVGQATTWGWIGLTIVAVVIAGMAFVFYRLGRR